MTALELFALNLKKMRLELGLSQESLAELTDLHSTYISDVECLRRNISLNNVQKIADALNTKVYKLFLEEDSNNE